MSLLDCCQRVCLVLSASMSLGHILPHWVWPWPCGWLWPMGNDQTSCWQLFVKYMNTGIFLPLLLLGTVCKQASWMLLVDTRSRHSTTTTDSQPMARHMIHCLWLLCYLASYNSELGQDQMVQVKRTSQSIARTKLISVYCAMKIFHRVLLFSESQDCLKTWAGKSSVGRVLLG